MTKKDLKEPRYSMQEMIVYLLLIFIFGNSTGAAIFSSSKKPSQDALMRIERKVESLERSVQSLRRQVQEIRLKAELKKK